MDELIVWLEATKLSQLIQNVYWIIPMVQCLHILAICLLMSSVLLLNLRLLGLVGGEAKEVFARRYLPWLWGALWVLFGSGLILIIGEPNRDLENWVFWTKMGLLLIAIYLTLIAERPPAARPDFWDTRRSARRVLAVTALLCWIGITLCGRWIAYTYAS